MKSTTMHTECSVCSIHFPRRRLVAHPCSTLQIASPPRAPQTTGAMAPQQVNSPENSAPRSSSEVNDTRMVAVSGRSLYERHTPNQCRLDVSTNSTADAIVPFCVVISFPANRCYTAIDRRTNSLVQVGTPLFFDLPQRFFQAQASPPPPGFTPFLPLPFKPEQTMTIA